MKTRRFKKDIPPEKGEETGIAMDNMKPSGSCPEKIEVVVVVVVECYCFLIIIIVRTFGARPLCNLQYIR